MRSHPSIHTFAAACRIEEGRRGEGKMGRGGAEPGLHPGQIRALPSLHVPLLLLVQKVPTRNAHGIVSILVYFLCDFFIFALAPNVLHARGKQRSQCAVGVGLEDSAGCQPQPC